MPDWRNNVLERDEIAEARNLLARLVQKTYAKIEEKLDADKDGAAFDMPTSEAPVWVQGALRLAANAAKVQDTAGTGATNLQLVVIERAKDSAQWLEMARPFQRQIAERKAEVIEADAKALPVEVEKK